jgi:hypothetical protein
MKERMSITLAADSPLGKAGQRVSLELTPADVHDPAEIPSYLAGYKNSALRADEMSKVVLVDNDEDKFRTFSQDDAFEPVRVKGALTGPIPEVDPRSSLDSYKVVDRYIGSFVPVITEMQRGNNYAPRMAAARRCRNALMLDRELDVCGPSGLLTTSGNWAAGQVHTLAAGEQWNGGVDANPIVALQHAIEASAQPIAEIWMNQKLAHLFISNANVRDHMRQLLGDGNANNIAVGVANMAATGAPIDFMIPGLPPIKVMSAKYKNSSGALTYIMPDYVVLLTTPPGVPSDGEEIATSYTFRRRGPSGVGIEAREFVVEGRGPHGGTMVVIAMADIAKMTGSNCGGLINGVIQ